jgi:SPP1 family predicted phage head-tail adaptor
MKYNKNEVTGKMRDRIILQNVNRSRSLTGFASESWADTATIWAFAESKLPGSNETIIDGKNTAKNVSDFTIRYISTISEESRIVWGDKLYQVKNLKVSHDRRFISFTGVFYDSYILTGVNVAASVNGIATTSANLKIIMSVMAQANAIASAIGEITTSQQGLVEVASSVVANGTSTANVTKVIPINSNIAANANVSATAIIVQNISSSVQASATSIADMQLVKTFIASANANATASSILTVTTQGVTSVDASVTATGTTTANLLRIATLESSATTTANTSAEASLTKVLDASASATAQTSAEAQITIPVNANATATANTSADAQLLYTVNAAADATAQTSADAFITRIISANATATANSSAEAGIGVTFVAAAVASASVTDATIFRTATLAASITGQGTTVANVTTVDNVAASITGTATVTNATLTASSPVDADATAFFLRVTTAGGSLTSTEQSAVDTLVKSMKANGTWSKMTAIYPVVGASAAACSQNLKSASFEGTFTGCTFATTGVTPNGTSGFLDTNCNPNSFTSWHKSIYSRTTNTTGRDMGIDAFDLILSLGGTIYSRFGSSVVITSNADSKGFYISTEAPTLSHKLFKNGSQLGSTASFNGSYPNYKIYIGAISDANVANYFSSREFAFASIGEGLTDTEATNLNTAVQTFQSNLGRAV